MDGFAAMNQGNDGSEQPQQPSGQQPQQPAAEPKPAPAPQQTGADGWKKAAQTTDVAHDDAMDQQQIQPKPVTLLPTPPPDATRVPRKGLVGMMDKFADAVAGTDTSKVRTDPQGNLYIQHETPTRGQQWLKIGATALAGAGAGLAAGPPAKALAAGFKEGEQLQQAQTEADKQKMLQVANSQALTHQTAVQALQLADMKRKGTEEDINFSQAQEDRLTKQGAQIVGHAADGAELFKLMRETPNFAQNQAQENAYRTVRTFDGEGNPTGLDVYKVVPGHENEVMPAGTEFHVWDPVKHVMTTEKTTAPRLTSEVNALNQAAGNAADKYQLDLAKIEHDRNQDELKRNPPPKTETPSTTRLHDAEAEAARARASATRAGSLLPGDEGYTNPAPGTDPLANLPAPSQAAVRGLLDYTVNPDTFPPRKYAKAGQMDRQTAVGLAKMEDPNYDEKEFPSRSKLRLSFTSGKDADNIKSLNTAISHLGTLNSAAKALNNGNFQGFNWAGNQLKTRFQGDSAVTNFNDAANAVESELATVFKGTGATDQEIKAWRENLSASQSPKQLQDGIRTAIKLLDGRMQALDQKWSMGMKMPRSFALLSPDSRAVLHNLGVDSLTQRDEEEMRRMNSGQSAPGGAQAVTISPDGKYQWSGTAWVPRVQ